MAMPDMSWPACGSGADVCNRAGTAPVGQIGAPGVPIRVASASGAPRRTQPGGKVTFDLTADAPGDWAFHCHLLMHMHAGMFNVVTVRPMEGAAA